MRKIGIIGAGRVGATLSMRVAEAGLADVLLIDIDKKMVQGKVWDINDCLAVLSSSAKVECSDYPELKDADIVVITAGFARHPGMSREDLVFKNKEILQEVIEKVKQNASQAIVIVVSNPLDVMTYCAYILSGFPRKRVIGMSGVLDSARFSGFIARELDVSTQDVQAMVLGMHSDLMLPLIRYSTVCGIPLQELLDKQVIERLIKKTKERGGEIVAYAGNSAYYAPSASVFLMLKAIIKDEKRILPACVYLQGEYGLKNLCLGVPVKLGKEGIEEIVEVRLTEREKELLHLCAKKIREEIKRLNL
ncbi:MAG: malate dehydrogenase [Candidatus Omnitrophota bacterium]|nr:MAG: malate dehydrogenase [Candidatus Omnitrophota bacterium]